MLGLGLGVVGRRCVGARVAVVLFVMVFDCRAEGVLEDLGQDVIHVDWDITGFFFFFLLDESDYWFGLGGGG